MRTAVCSIALLVACDPLASSAPDPGTADAPTPSPIAAAPPPVATAAPSTAAPAPAADACDRAVRRYGELSARAGTPVGDDVLATERQKCATESWNAALVECTAKAESLDAIARECYKLAFDGRVAVDVRRKRDVLLLAQGQQRLEGDDPPFGTQPGDTLTFRHEGKSCAVVMAEAKPAVGAFIVCDGDVIAGPITHQSEIGEAAGMIGDAIAAPTIARANAAMRSASYDLARSVRERWPSGGRSYTVVDRRTGARLHDTY